MSTVPPPPGTPGPAATNPFGAASAPWLLEGPHLDQTMQKMHEAGVAWVRLDFAWQDMEPSRGVYDWSKYERIVQAAERFRLGIIALVPQYNVPAWANGGGGWNTPPQRPEEYGAFAQALAHHFRGRIRYYEIGNEPNSSAFWAPSPDAERYAALLRAAYRGIKASDPQMVVVAGGAAPWGPTFVDPVTWLRHLYAHGAPFDALGAHPYSAPRSPDDDSATYARFSLVRDLRAVMEQHRDGSKPIIITEIGWSTAGGASGVSPERQAAYIERVYEKIRDEVPYVTIACVYAFRDPATDPADYESNFGVLTHAYEPKPAFYALRDATSAHSRQASSR